jgi:hypothetical protein
MVTAMTIRPDMLGMMPVSYGPVERMPSRPGSRVSIRRDIDEGTEH